MGLPVGVGGVGAHGDTLERWSRAIDDGPFGVWLAKALATPDLLSGGRVEVSEHLCDYIDWTPSWFLDGLLPRAGPVGTAVELADDLRQLEDHAPTRST